MIRTTSVLNTSSSEVILINFRAHVQFHSDSSSSTRILETFARIVRLDFFTRKTIFHSDDYISTRMTIFPLGRHYLIQSASFRPDGNLFTRNIFTWRTISLGWPYFHSDDYISTWIIISSSGQQTFTRPVNFHSDGKLFHSDFRLKTQPDLVLSLQASYDLGLRRIIYKSRSSRRDKTFLCWRFFDSRRSWGPNCSRIASDTHQHVCGVKRNVLVSGLSKPYWP